ncbi:hypothetical protein PHJA_002017800 [Phtheirospermum japonicum]|uniref:Uncharacterized protein n=1 Tax=Phtheirospermum japonicum TaxID=374723 RepID=A0A830CIB4_9LAMI|nr:hypothetical protein PHJA_002017800 [Phtheirospermum japonicum]
MRYKSWPFFKDWCDIFGKDRATGENAQGLVDAVNEVLNNGQTDHLNGTPAPSIDHMTRSETVEISTGQEAESSATGKDRKGKKRKAVDSLQERFVALMESFFAKTDGRLGEMAMRIGFQQDVKLQRKAVFDALSQMHFLSIEDKLTVSKMLCKSGEDLDLFDSISDEHKMVMVKMMLDGRLLDIFKTGRSRTLGVVLMIIVKKPLLNLVLRLLELMGQCPVHASLVMYYVCTCFVLSDLLFWTVYKTNCTSCLCMNQEHFIWDSKTMKVSLLD